MTSTIRTPFTVDTRDIKKFALALRKVSPELYKGLRIQLRAAGQIVADEAKSRIAADSVSIPPTIKVRTTSASSVSVQAGNDNVPIAGLFEMGNKGRASNKTSFRHPVYGRDVWVDQPMHPYLVPALEAKSTSAVVAIGIAIDEVVRMIEVEG